MMMITKERFIAKMVEYLGMLDSPSFNVRDIAERMYSDLISQGN